MNSKSWMPRAAVLAMLAGLALPAVAADGLYLGIGAGASSVKDDFQGSTFQADDVAYRAFAGWRFDEIPIIDLAVEAAYTNFGKPSQVLYPSTGVQDVEYALHGPSLAGLVILPLGPFDLYAKGGVLDWNLDQTANGATSTRTGTSGFYGVGGAFYLWKLAFRLEYDRYQVKDVDHLQMLTLDVLLQF
ncbi:MAG TPA: outer membrane beta-barrel protein [Dehalococcoidia bacterium]|nr:outer membrane beta-barrel protein [Dehalococcoidia bacterium]